MKPKLIFTLAAILLSCLSSVYGQKSTLSIAYVDIDYIITNYDYAKVMEDSLKTKMKKSEDFLKEKQAYIQSEHSEFERKIKDNLFASVDIAEKEMKRIQSLSNDLEQEATKIELEVKNEEDRVYKILLTKIGEEMKDYNKKANYEMILSNSGISTIITAKDSYDITNDVLRFLNEKYATSKGRK